MQAVERDVRLAAVERARREGLPVRVERPDGTVQELVDFEGDRPVYFTTHNVNAAITTGVSVLRASPYGLTGSGLTIGVWDGGSGRATHQEFGGRLVSKDGAASIDHATHVSGTIAAAGVVAAAQGMATSINVDSYDWNSDKSEMTARAATAPNQAGMLYLSNHSYGYVGGWNYVNGGSPARVWEWNGDGTTSAGYEYDFGRYNTYSRDSDALAYSAPYYLMFRSAGNDRVDNPSQGQAVALSPAGTTVVSYDSALHPAGDGVYRAGFEGIGFDALGKNVITVGSVADAVTNGARDVSKASVSSFSSWGPTDDGRIKPDIVANGEDLYSSLNGSDTSYGSYSGTSMATPNALGTAALLFEDYARLFFGGAMRASTLKGLLIHTADDRGNPGPDYKYGWGLVNGQAASDLLRDHAAHSLKHRITEGIITAASTTVNLDFVWDGVTPIRATLCWTDPAGTATTTNDLRTTRLVNNLDLKIVGPAGTEHLPYVMPFVGTWTQAAMDMTATTGKNITDNVEQVFIASPPAAGVYRCVVTITGTLTNTEQRYSLLLTGAADQVPPPPALSLTAVSPTSSLPGVANVTVTGAGFQSGATLKLKRTGSSDLAATGVQLGANNESITGQFNLAGAAADAWDVVVTDPGGETVTLLATFTVLPALWCETFDGAVSGWTSAATTGSNNWSLSTTQSQSPSTSFFASGPSSKTTCSLTSPAIAVPSGATGLQFRFWHRYSFQNARDGGRLEFSLDGGAWFDVTASGSGATFASNGYTTTIGASSKGKPVAASDFVGLSAWSGSTTGFIETIVNLTDTAQYAGHALRARWILATDGATASTGWYIDSVSLVGGIVVNAAPVVATPAATDSTTTVTDGDGTVFSVVSGRETSLSVAATDDGGEPALTYTWSASSATGPAVSFSVNGNNAAKSAVALFEGSGDYVVTVAIRDAAGLTTTSSVNVRVVATDTALSVSPAVASITLGGQLVYSATLLDQFGVALATQPSSFTWSVSGGGTISAAGLFTSSSAGGPYVVTAISGGFSAVAAVTVNRAAATVTLGNLTQTYDGTAKSVGVTTSPAGLAVSVTYDGVASPPVAVGDYAVEAIVIDPNYQGGATGTLVIQPRRYALTVTASPAEGGTVTGAGTYDEGNTAVITAVAASGWRFIGWTGAGPADPATATTTVTMDAAKSVTATFVAKTGYELWAEAHALTGGAADPQADPDGDGLANLLEYATATDPDAPGVSVVTHGLANGALTLTFHRIADPALIYTVEATNDLGGTWSPLAVAGNPSTGAANVAGDVTIADTVALADQPRRFLRLRISYP